MPTAVLSSGMSMDMEAKSEAPQAAMREFQLDFKKIMSLSVEERDIIMQLIKTLTSNGDWENKTIIKNTLISLGLIITKRENAINEYLS